MHQQQQEHQQHQQPPVVIQQPYAISGTGVDSFSVKVTATRRLGIIQIVLGALCCLFGIFVAVFVDVWIRYISASIWGGILVRIFCIQKLIIT